MSHRLLRFHRFFLYHESFFFLNTDFSDFTDFSSFVTQITLIPQIFNHSIDIRFIRAIRCRYNYVLVSFSSVSSVPSVFVKIHVFVSFLSVSSAQSVFVKNYVFISFSSVQSVPSVFVKNYVVVILISRSYASRGSSVRYVHPSVRHPWRGGPAGHRVYHLSFLHYHLDAQRCQCL